MTRRRRPCPMSSSAAAISETFSASFSVIVIIQHPPVLGRAGSAAGPERVALGYARNVAHARGSRHRARKRRTGTGPTPSAACPARSGDGRAGLVRGGAGGGLLEAG